MAFKNHGIGILLLVFSVLWIPALKADEAAPLRFEDAVAFEYTLASLAEQVSSGDVNSIPKDRVLIIDATVSMRQLIDPGEETYFGILELSSGEWESGEDLTMHYGYVQLRGPKFFGTIPEARSRSVSPREIPLHSHVLILGYYLGYGEGEGGGRFPVLEAVDFRILQQ
jgi:hypothetical protein